MNIKVIITGATGMVGKGVLLECLESQDIETVLAINRHSHGMEHPKLKEIVCGDFYDLSSVEQDLSGYDACFFCLGVSALGMSEEAYSRVTCELTVHFAETLVRLNPGMTFCYVSGAGTDSTERGRSMWARVKGRTENAIRALPFRKTYMFRPGVIQPLKGIRSRTGWYNAMYAVVNPLFPVLKAVFPKAITTTVNVGQAMIKAVTKGFEKDYLENREINALSER